MSLIKSYSCDEFMPKPKATLIKQVDSWMWCSHRT